MWLIVYERTTSSDQTYTSHQTHSPVYLLGCTRQIGQTHDISCASLLETSACNRIVLRQELRHST